MRLKQKGNDLCASGILTAGLILACFSLSSAETVVFETDFSELPQNWYSSGFICGPDGAVLDLTTSGNFDATLCTGGVPAEPLIFIPDGADSVQIRMLHHLDVSGGEYPNFDFTVSLLSHSTAWETVWTVSIDHSNPQVFSTYNETFSPGWLLGGDCLGLHFRVDGVGDQWGSSITWRIEELEVTVFGESLNFSQRSWGAIKATL